MDKKEFKKFCVEEIKKNGFHKEGKQYYLYAKKDVICMVSFEFSNYSPAMGICYTFYTGNYENPTQYPNRDTLFDYCGYIQVLSRDTYKGEHFMWGMISYEEYTKEELIPYFDMAFKELILPPVYNGKECLEALAAQTGHWSRDLRRKWRTE